LAGPVLFRRALNGPRTWGVGRGGLITECICEKIGKSRFRNWGGGAGRRKEKLAIPPKTERLRIRMEKDE